MKNLSRTTARRSGKQPGKKVEEYLKDAKISLLKELRAAITSIINASPGPDDGEIGFYPSDIVDAVLAALVEFTDVDMICDRILERDDFAENIHERTVNPN